MSDKDQVIACYRKLYAAMVNQDTAALEQVLAPEMTLTHMTGYVQSRDEWISQVGDGQMRYYQAREDNIKDVVVTGEHASLTGQNQVQASIWGSSKNWWRLQLKATLAKRNGRWLITKQVASTY